MTPTVFHGGLSDAERASYSQRGIELIDLSASLNPYGPHPAVVRAARTASFDRYPETDARSLRDAYANASGLAPGSVLAGNGSSELIYLATRANGGGGGTGVIIGPTFGEYAPALHAAGLTVETWNASPPDFAPCVEQIRAYVRARKPRVVFLCNPNNPTSALVARADIERLTAATVDAGGTLLVDEAYMPFAYPDEESSGPAPGRMILRSLTKLHAIPGLRLGFLLGEPAAMRGVAALQPPWAVSAPAVAAGLRALEEAGFALRSRERVAETKRRLVAVLWRAGFAIPEPHANFILVEVGDGDGFRRGLMERGFVVRDCASFGLPGHVRVAIPPERDRTRLAAAMMAVREETAR